MGWLRLVGSFKSQVSFAKETYKRDDILQKENDGFKEPTNNSYPIVADCGAPSQAARPVFAIFPTYGAVFCMFF